MTKPTNEMRVDFGRIIGDVRPLHGVNFGPLSFCGLHDFSAHHQKLQIPSTRLHDCPYAAPGTVDIHNLFPLFHAAVDDPRNYVFAITDDYIQAIKDIGSDIVFRLGETIEHYKRNKYFIHPPPDFDKWAEICLRVIRHYNAGWANGFHHGITYWEIWNEPWALCWTGTPEQFYHLYATAAKKIKAVYPHLKVGSGGTDKWNEFAAGLARHCQQTGAPLDFLAWHSYQNHPRETARLGREMRSQLDAAGFSQTELHLNEWGYIPDNDWSFVSADAPKVASLVGRIQGAAGAAYVATVLAWLQELPVDLANYYWAREDFWGLFDHWGRPTGVYRAFAAFVDVLKLKHRVFADGNDEQTGRAILASVAPETNTAAILVSNFEPATAAVTIHLDNLPWSGVTEVEQFVIDDHHAYVPVKRERFSGASAVRPELIPAPAVCVYRLKKIV